MWKHITQLVSKIKESGGRVIFPLLILIALFGFVPDRGLSFRVGKTLVMEWCLTTFIILFFLKNIWLRLFVMWTLIRFSMGTIGYSMPPSAAAEFGLISYVTFNTILVCTTFLQVLINKNYPREYLLNLIAYVGLLQALMMITQYSGIWLFIIPKEMLKDGIIPFSWGYIGPSQYSTAGFLSNINMAGSLLALTLPAFFRHKWILLSPIIILGIILSNSWGAWIPAGMVLLGWFLYAIRKQRNYFHIILLFVGCVIAHYCIMLIPQTIEYIKANDRYQVWMVAIQNIVPMRPWEGWGLGQFKKLFPLIHSSILKEGFRGEFWFQLHNEYLQSIIELGFIGFTFICGYFSLVIHRGIRYKLWIPLIGIGVCLFNAGVNFLAHTVVFVVVLIYIALIEGEHYGKS